MSASSNELFSAEPYDKFFTAEFHELEKRVMTLECRAVLDLIDAERKIRRAIRVLYAHHGYYRDGWIEPFFWDEFMTSIKDALSLGQTT